MILVKPNDYASNGEDLFDRFENGVIRNPDQVRGSYKGNMIRYLSHY